MPAGWYIAQGFDEEYTATGKPAVHPGFDLNRIDGADFGLPVYAAADGRVVACQFYPVWGNVVLIHHDTAAYGELWSQYAHLRSMEVVPGEFVRRGGIIGAIGRGDGDRYAAHLHFEIRRAQLAPQAWPGLNHEKVRRDYLNPLTLIGLET